MCRARVNLCLRPMLLMGIALALTSNLPLGFAQGTSAPKLGVEIGEAAPDFELPIVGEDEFLQLKDNESEGPTVIVFLRGYPGYQCPLCSQQVGALINRAKTLASLTPRVILVYPGQASQLERHAEEFMTGRTLPKPFVLVRDADMKVVSQYNLRWNASNETSYPAAFVIDKNNRIRWSKISESHAGRATAEEIVSALRKL